MDNNITRKHIIIRRIYYVLAAIAFSLIALYILFPMTIDIIGNDIDIVVGTIAIGLCYWLIILGLFFVKKNIWVILIIVIALFPVGFFTLMAIGYNDVYYALKFALFSLSFSLIRIA